MHGAVGIFVLHCLIVLGAGHAQQKMRPYLQYFLVQCQHDKFCTIRWLLMITHIAKIFRFIWKKIILPMYLSIDEYQNFRLDDAKNFFINGIFQQSIAKA